MKQKALLILGASNDQLFMINTAKKMGLITVVIDGNLKAPGLKLADYASVIDFSDVNAVIEYCSQLISKGVNLNGVLTMGSDIPHLLAAIAKPFNWVSPSIKTAEITTNKLLMKILFKKHGIATSNFALVNNDEEIKKQWQKWKCDNIIIKPVDAAGSRGVSICQHQAEIKSLYQHAKINSKKEQVIIEEFIEGEQLSTETIISNNQYYHPGFATRVYKDTQHFYPYIMENGGWQPSEISYDKKEKTHALIEKVAKALNIREGVLKGDIVYSTKYNKPMIIEVASRLSGGDFSASLVPLAHNINYIKTAINIALGEPIDTSELIIKSNYIVANRYFFVPQGKLLTISGIKQAQQIAQLKKLEFNYQVNDVIPKIENHGQRVGVFIIQGESYRQVQQLIEQVYNTITFNIDGTEQSGHPEDYRA